MENYKQISYIIKQTTRKNSIAMVFVKDYAEIRVPKRTSKKTVENFIKKHYDFILEKINNSNYVERNYVDADEFLIAGDLYKLAVFKGDNKVEVKANIINLYVKNEDDLDLKKELIINYYKSLAKIDIKGLVLKYSEKMDLYPAKVKLNKAEKRWGSCNWSTKTLNFTIRNAMLPYWVQEYIVVHELAHLKHPDHSKNFWNYVEQFLPGYKQAEEYLKINNHLLKF